MSPEETNGAQVESAEVLAASVPAPGEPWRRSDCCYAPVTEHVDDYHTSRGAPDDAKDEEGKAHWQGVTFTCNDCGNECAPYTNPLLAQLSAEREGKEVQDDA